jgi:hypothetical protein
MEDLEKDAFWRAKVSNLMRGAVCPKAGQFGQVLVSAKLHLS